MRRDKQVLIYITHAAINHNAGCNDLAQELVLGTCRALCGPGSMRNWVTGSCDCANDYEWVAASQSCQPPCPDRTARRGTQCGERGRAKSFARPQPDATAMRLLAAAAPA